MHNGVLPIYKPKGMHTGKITRSLRLMLGQTNIGHVGTLDPAAQGLMLILVGKATRLEPLLHLFPKTYVVVAEFGYETDTLDAEGTVIARSESIDFSRRELFSACQRYVGQISQVPPLFAAVKYRGRPLYYYARRNLSVPLTQLHRQVCITSLRIITWHRPRLELSVTCEKGVYIRSLVRDIAHSLGSHATVLDIIRTEAYGLDSRDAWPFAEITAANAHTRLQPVASLPLPRLQVRSRAQLRRLQNGNKLPMYDERHGCNARHMGSFLITDTVDKVLGIGSFVDDGKSLQMRRSLCDADSAC